MTVDWIAVLMLWFDLLYGAWYDGVMIGHDMENYYIYLCMMFISWLLNFRLCF